MPEDTEKPLLPLIVHDLRNPLNAIVMSLHLVEAGIPEGSDEVRRDLLLIHDSVRQIQRMLRQVGDYGSVIEQLTRPIGPPCRPEEVLQEAIAAVADCDPLGAATLEVVPRTWAGLTLHLDVSVAVKAIQCALENALAAAKGSPVRVESRSSPDRWALRITTVSPPARTLRGGEVRPGEFERILGNAHERRGLDLGVVTRASESVGGSVRLEVEPGQSSTLVIEWPAQVVRPE